MIQSWRITPTQNIQLDLRVSSLDQVTQQLPDGFYSTFRTFDGGSRVLGLTEHFRRLYGPVSAPNVSESFLRKQLSTLLEPYRPGEARVRVMMTREGQAYIALAPLTLLAREIYEKGVRAETTELRREHPRLKSTSFISRSDAERKHIAEEGIFEALLVKDGRILEGMTSNFFYVAPPALRSHSPSAHSAQPKAILCTAREDILFGITRQTVLEIAQGRGLEVEDRTLLLNQIAEISEAFMTSSSRGIVPIVEINTIPIGEGEPGPITRELSVAYETYVRENAERIV